MGQQGFLTDEIATGGHAVFEGDGLYGDAVVLIDDGLFGGIHRMEHHLKAQVMGEESNLIVQHGAQCLRGMDMKGSSTTQEAEGGYHPYQTKAMVTMQMGDEHPTEFGEVQMAFPHLRLCSLSAVEHQQPVPHLYEL